MSVLNMTLNFEISKQMLNIVKAFLIFKCTFKPIIHINKMDIMYEKRCIYKILNERNMFANYDWYL